MQNRDKLGVLNKITAIYNHYQNNETCFLGIWICPYKSVKSTGETRLGRKKSKCYNLLGENDFRDL